MSTILHNPGTRLGPYRLLEPVGKGLSGEVWTAVSEDGTLVAVKLFDGVPEAVARKEYDTGAGLEHPSLLHPLEYRTEAGLPMMVLPYCVGRSVNHVSGHIPERMVWQLVRDSASALVYLNGKGLCHRDIKPSNILWNGTRFILSDFGSAAPLAARASQRDLSSYQFAPPEKDSSLERSDIWSLGASVFHLVLGRGVFGERGGQGQTPGSAIPIMRAGMPALSALISRCLAYEPAQRPSAEELLEEATRELQREKDWSRERPTKGLPPAQTDGPYPFWPERMTDV
jgi:serine/threonine-protein kinase